LYLRNKRCVHVVCGSEVLCASEKIESLRENYEGSWRRPELG
jgi:hypothetical protein